MTLGIIVGTLIVMSVESWPLTWLGLELNLICFIPLTIKEERRKRPSIIYFICQRIGSLVILICGLVIENNSYILPMIIIAIVIKLGAVPIHFWVPIVIPLLSKWRAFITLSWQKVAPFSLFYSVQLSKWILSLTNVLVGAISMMALSSIISVIIFSGIVQIGWIFCLDGFYFWSYVCMYFLVLYPIFIYIFSSSKNFALRLFNAGGLPPFTGFFIKLGAIIRLPSWIRVFLLFSRAISLISYTRILINNTYSINKISSFILIPLFVGILFL